MKNKIVQLAGLSRRTDKLDEIMSCLMLDLPVCASGCARAAPTAPPPGRPERRRSPRRVAI